MRDFNETDKRKKAKRIVLDENPGGLSQQALTNLESRIRAALQDNYLSCAVALKIAREENVPPVAVGVLADRIGVRVTDCQIGCFKIDKSIHHRSNTEPVDQNVLAALSHLEDSGELTCANVFQAALRLNLPVGKVAGVANSRSMKIGTCQLGCF